MIDTVGVQYPIPVNKDFLSSWGYERKLIGRGFTSRYQLVVSIDNGCEVFYRYIPRIPQGYPLLQVEFSLSHLVYGDNVYMIYDLEGTINQANLMLPVVPGIPELDLWNGILYRLDICYNFQVGKLVPFYIHALSPLEYSRRKMRPYSNQGIQWGNKQASLKFYNKERWYADNKLPNNPDARGILRLEITLRKGAVKRLTGQKYPSLHDITIEMALDALERELGLLSLLNRSIGTYDSTLSTLCEIYGTDAGFCYFGALAAKVEYPDRNTVVAASGIHPRSLDRRLKKVLAAGLPLTMTKTEEPLPALSIDREMVMEMVKQSAIVMKYQVIHQDLQNSMEILPESKI